MNLLPYFAQFKIQLREDSRNFPSLIISSFAHIGYVSVVLLFYSATNLSAFFGNFTWPMLVWYFIVAQVLISNQDSMVKVISNQIQNGDIVSALSKPYYYPFAMLAVHLAECMIESSALLLLAIPLGLFLAGTSPLTVYGIVFGVIIVMLAYTLDFFISMCIGLIAFWTEDASPYRWVYAKILFILGGLLFPLDIFPPAFQTVVKLLPPAFLLYYPARLVVNFSWGLLETVVLGQLAYLIIFAILARLIYAKAIRKVNINGG